MNIIHRFHTCSAANIILSYAKQLTNAKLYVDKSTPDDTREDKPGEWYIGCDDIRDSFDRSKLYDCIQMATSLALADDLARYNPSASLLTIWHLKQENREKIGRYNLTQRQTN